jgi:hypothetical protein
MSLTRSTINLRAEAGLNIDTKTSPFRLSSGFGSSKPLSRPSSRTAPIARLGTLEWPPPPSPAASKRPVALTAYEEDDEEPVAVPTSNRPAEIRNRAELWAIRAEIEREKMRHVLSFPFFGRAMRFQDATSALQITDDGRFSYSIVTQPTVDSLESFLNFEDPPVPTRTVTTYEGILVRPPSTEVARQDAYASNVSQEESSSIEGAAFVLHEIEDAGGSGSRLVKVERGDFRFEIQVFTGVDPNRATVLAIGRPRSPGKPPKRRKELPYVGPGPTTRETAPMSPVAAAKRHLQQERRKTMKLKFANTGSNFSLNMFSSPFGQADSRMLGQSASAPQLYDDRQTSAAPRRSMMVSAGTRRRTNFGQLTADFDQDSSGENKFAFTLTPSDARKRHSQFVKPHEDGKKTLDDWRGFYRQRAATLMAMKVSDS